MKYDVLGTPYEVLFGVREQLNMTEDHMGECRIYSKKILICDEQGDCTEEELDVRVSEIVAHEVFHAYLNEAGIEIDEDSEELVANFFMKNWKKMSNTILEILDENGYLTE